MGVNSFLLEKPEKGDKHFVRVTSSLKLHHRKESPDIEVSDIGCTARITVKLNECTR